MIRRLLPVLVAVALTGCGFHLRDQITVPMQVSPLHVVSADRYSPLAETIAQALERGGVTVIREGGEGAVLDIVAEQWGDTPISVDALGRSQEFSLRYAVIFELRDAAGTVLVPRQTIELARDYVQNPTNAIGAEGERETLGRELRREMAFSVLRRVDAVFKAGAVPQQNPPIPQPAITPNPADAAAGNPGG
ncbi:MAG TPA: LPS assembly lipoprotein LptE [Lysobacter sp.]|nr:LPS assembly lipoprotein LptE [Lysobacter sp.]